VHVGELVPARPRCHLLHHDRDRLKGEIAFTLYDTYGFPLDLTQDALRPRGIGVDTDAFSAAMERQREKARASWAGSGEAATDAVWFALRERVGATEFLGYETEGAEAVIVGLVRDRKLHPRVDATYAFADAAQAVADWNERRVVGKGVVRVREG